MLLNLQDKVNKLVSLGDSLEQATEKVMNDFGDLNELIEVYGMDMERQVGVITNLSRKLLLFGSILNTLYICLYLLYNYGYGFRYLYFRTIYVNPFNPIFQNLLILTIFTVIGWIFYAYCKSFSRINSLILIMIGIITIILNSYLVGVFYLLTGMINAVYKLNSKYILMTLILNLFLYILYITGYIIDAIINVNSSINVIRFFETYFNLINFLIYLFMIIFLFVLLILKKELKRFIDLGFYLILFIQILQIITGNIRYLILGFPILIVIVLLKIHKTIGGSNIYV